LIPILKSSAEGREFLYYLEHTQDPSAWKAFENAGDLVLPSNMHYVPLLRASLSRLQQSGLIREDAQVYNDVRDLSNLLTVNYRSPVYKYYLFPLSDYAGSESYRNQADQMAEDVRKLIGTYVSITYNADNRQFETIEGKLVNVKMLGFVSIIQVELEDQRKKIFTYTLIPGGYGFKEPGVKVDGYNFKVSSAAMSANPQKRGGTEKEAKPIAKNQVGNVGGRGDPNVLNITVAGGGLLHLNPRLQEIRTEFGKICDFKAIQKKDLLALLSIKDNQNIRWTWDSLNLYLLSILNSRTDLRWEIDNKINFTRWSYLQIFVDLLNSNSSFSSMVFSRPKTEVLGFNYNEWLVFVKEVLYRAGASQAMIVRKINEMNDRGSPAEISQASKRGGIDLNTANMGMTITKDAQGGVKVNFDPAVIERIRQQGIQSAIPVIIDVRMMTSAEFRPLLGK
jgi:hypothetical protein